MLFRSLDGGPHDVCHTIVDRQSLAIRPLGLGLLFVLYVYGAIDRTGLLFLTYGEVDRIFVNCLSRSASAWALLSAAIDFLTNNPFSRLILASIHTNLLS